MLTAKRQSDNLKVVGDDIEKDPKERYFCDFCGNEVIHHKSDSHIRAGHFKHKTGQSFCPNNINESVWHLKTKLDIFRHIKQIWGNELRFIGIEEWLADRTIRADIFIETRKGNKIAIEVQASVLQVMDIKKRTEKYFREDIYVLWILPYDYNRFNKLQKDYGWLEDKTWGIKDQYWIYAPSVRLKEYEIFLFWCYYKQLLFWDLEHKYSSDFTVIELKDCVTDLVSFYEDGEEVTYGGSKTKTTKSVEIIRHNVEFNKLTPRYANEFDLKYRKYVIPERKIFTYYDKQKTTRTT